MLCVIQKVYRIYCIVKLLKLVGLNLNKVIYPHDPSTDHSETIERRSLLFFQAVFKIRRHATHLVKTEFVTF